MRILVHEFASGGGLAGRPVPASLSREGAAMRDALVADLAALRRHRVVTTVDLRFPMRAPPGVEVVTLPPGGDALLDGLMASADGVWLVAPETDRCLERLATRVERKGKALLGTGAAAIRRASDKEGLARRLARCGVAHPATRVLREDREGQLAAGDLAARELAVGELAARELGYPVVVKPARGAGCLGVCLARNPSELRTALELARRADGRGPVLLQRYVRGVAASVSLLADDQRAVALAVNAQWVRAARPFSYRGGRTPLAHRLAARAVQAALRTCQALPGLRGYVGVDMVLTESEAVVIEVNPRLTTAYLGVRRAIEGNVAALALAACRGALPVPPPLRRQVRYTAGGRVLSAGPQRSALGRP